MSNYNARGIIEKSADSQVGCKRGLCGPRLMEGDPADQDSNAIYRAQANAHDARRQSACHDIDETVTTL
jgi:hypothetical protein